MKFIDPRAAGALALVTTLAACVVPPPGPTIPVAPGPGKSFDAFAADQNFCAQYANSQTAPAAAAANNQAVGGAIIGTALGAGLGAAIGGGRGAAIGAASGAIVGTGAGAAQAQGAGNNAFWQAYNYCMSTRAPAPPPPAYGAPPPGYQGGYNPYYGR